MEIVIQMKTEIRQYQAQDLNDLLSTWEKSSRLAHPFMAEDFFEKERYNIPNLYIPNTDTWVVTVNNKVIGFIALIGKEIGGLFVEPDFHGRGLGKKLVDKAKEIHGNLEVHVFKENAIGRNFYDRYGFEFADEKVWEETGDILLRLELTV